MDSLDLRYSKSILIKVLELQGHAILSDLKEIATNWRSLKDVVFALKEDGYLDTSEEIAGRKVIHVSLTARGTRVAEQLKRTQEVAKGEITEEGAQFKMPPDWRDRFKGLSAMTHLNVLDDHVAIQEIDHSGRTTSVIMVYVKRINSHFELWCEKDETKECKHVDFAWSLPHMRALIEEYIKEGKIKEVGRVD